MSCKFRVMHILKLKQSYAPAVAGFFYAYTKAETWVQIWKGRQSLQTEIKGVAADACNQVESIQEKIVMSEHDTIDTPDRFPNRFKKGNPGGPGRPKGVKNGEGKVRSRIPGNVATKHDMGAVVERENVPAPRKKGGRPKGKKNKFSLSAADRMIELGFDPIEEYLDLLGKVRGEGNRQLEERILSRLVPFRFAQLNHTMLTDTKDLDLQVKVAQFQVPESLGKIDTPNTDNSQDSSANETDSQLGVNVTRFAPKPG